MIGKPNDSFDNAIRKLSYKDTTNLKINCFDKF